MMVSDDLSIPADGNLCYDIGHRSDNEIKERQRLHTKDVTTELLKSQINVGTSSLRAAHLYVYLMR